MKATPTTADLLTGVLKASIEIERLIAQNHQDILKAQSTRRKLQDLINKYSPK